MQTTNTVDTPGLKVTPIGWEETRAILRPKFKAGDHWIIVGHAAALPFIRTIERKYYLNEKNSNFTLIIALWRGQPYALVAARKRWMRHFQFTSLLR